MIYIYSNNVRHPDVSNFTTLHYTSLHFTQLHFSSVILNSRLRKSVTVTQNTCRFNCKKRLNNSPLAITEMFFHYKIILPSIPFFWYLFKEDAAFKNF